MAPEPSTRLKVSVRIGAHAITAFALGVAAPSQASDVAQAWLDASPAELVALREKYRFGLDHGGAPGHARILAQEAVIDAMEADGWPIVRIPPAPPPTGYRGPEVGDALLRELAATAPRGGVVAIGRSVEGREILALWLGQPPESGAPAHRILAAHHGDEVSSVEVALEAATAFAAGDGADPAITALLDAITLWVVPYVNPDGVTRATRWNATLVDLNRNYDYAWSADEYLAGPAPFSEPETRAVASWAQWAPPVLGLSLHAGATNVGYVWNWTLDDAPDVDDLRAHAERYAASVADPGFYVTNGAAWYITRGDTNDWTYGRQGAWDFTVELTDDKAPPPDQILAFTRDHLPAVLDFVSVLPDLSGLVVDAPTGHPLDATVALEGPTGPRGQPFRTAPGTGSFHHLDSGATDLVVTASGYRDARVPVGSAGPIALVRDGVDGRVVLPAPASAKQPLELPDAYTGAVTLEQTGYAPITTRSEGGVLAVPADALGAGAWTAVRADGVVHRNALMVNDPDPGPVRIDRVRLDAGGATQIDGAGFAEGTRVWALYGDDRARMPVPVLAIAPDTVTVDATDLPATGRVDLWVLSQGAAAFAPDLHGNDPDTWGFSPYTVHVVGRACACEVKTGHLPRSMGSWIATLLLLVLRRRT